MEERLRDLSAILKSGRFRDLRSGIQNTDTNLKQMYCYTNKEQTNKVMEIHLDTTLSAPLSKNQTQTHWKPSEAFQNENNRYIDCL